MSSSSSIVEFIGLPGAGKSTLCQEVKKILLSQKMYTPSRTQTLELQLGPKWLNRSYRRYHLYLPRFVIQNRSYVWQSIQIISKTKQDTFTNTQKMTLHWLRMSHYVHCCHNTPGIHMMDQGMVQSLWSVGLDCQSDKTKTLLYSLSKIMFSPTILVIVNADLSAIQRRLEMRGKGSRLFHRVNDEPHLLQRAEKLMTDVKALVLPPDFGLESYPAVITVNNSADYSLQSNAAVVADFIQSTTRQRYPKL